MVEQWVDARPLDDLQLKGFNHPVLAVEILRWREASEQAGGCRGGGGRAAATEAVARAARVKRKSYIKGGRPDGACRGTRPLQGCPANARQEPMIFSPSMCNGTKKYRSSRIDAAPLEE